MSKDAMPYQPRVTLRTLSIEAVRSMVANFLGVTILLEMVYRPGGGKAGGSKLMPPMDIHLAWRADADFTPGHPCLPTLLPAGFRPAGHQFLKTDDGV